MSEILEALFHRRAVKVFESVQIPQVLREQISMQPAMLPSSFQYATVPVLLGGIVAEKGNRGETLPWTDACGNGIGTGGCGGRHRVAGSDLASPVGVDAQERLQPRQSPRLRADGEDRPDSVHARNRSAFFGAVKWAIFRLVNLWKTIGMPPVFRQDLLKWATKSTSLACENLMIAAEALGLNTCPMEGFDGRRTLPDFSGCQPGIMEIVMVIAIGKKSSAYAEPPQWRRPLDVTVTVL